MTAVATPRHAAPRAGQSSARRGALVGTGALVRFILRRDRLRLPLWLLALTAVTAGTAVSLEGVYPTQEVRQTTAETMATPAGTAMSGPVEYLADYNLGAMMSHQMLGFMALMVGVMSILTIVRHTRAEEESGRAELLRASVVGRHAHLAAALSVTVVANLLLAALIAAAMASLGLDGVGWAGSLLYGAAHAAVGIVFAGVAAITVQVSGYPRGASGMGFGLLGLSYVLRASGDVAENGLSWLSPIGWAQATYAYVDDRWWPLAIAVVCAAVLVAGAVALSVRRDVGAGLRQARPGRATATELLARPVGLALRLHRGLLIGWVVAVALIGVTYGSILADVEDLLAEVEMLDQALAQIGGTSLVESYVSMIMVVMAIMASVYVVLATLRPRSEEDAGRAEPVLATPLSRPRWLGSHLVVALLGGAAVLLAGGLGLGLVGAAVLEDSGFVGEAVGASLAYVPALWVTAGVAAALYGIVPRLAALAWLVPVYAFFVGYLGQILDFADWMDWLSPFAHVPQLPADDLALTPLAALTVVAAALFAVGIAAFRRRGLTGP